VQRAVPEANVVKAYNTVGNTLIVDSGGDGWDHAFRLLRR
jgi:predicted dinucleotide-binding enzyme